MSKKKRKLSKGQLGKRILYFDLLFLLITGVWAMVLASMGRDASSTLTVIYAVGGGELLLLMLKRLFGDRGNNNEG